MAYKSLRCNVPLRLHLQRRDRQVLAERIEKCATRIVQSEHGAKLEGMMVEKAEPAGETSFVLEDDLHHK